MQQDTKLWENRFDSIKKDTWLRQRFDARPHFMFFLGDAHISEIQHTGYSYGQRIAYAGFSKNRADWYHSLTELRYTANGIITASKKNKDIGKEMITAFKPWETQFYELCKEISERNLSAMSNEELLEFYNKSLKGWRFGRGRCKYGGG